MLQAISTVEDVQKFFMELKNEDLNFHPDTPFEDYINIDTGLPIYTDAEVTKRNVLLEQAFDVCDKIGSDIYEIGFNIFYLR